MCSIKIIGRFVILVLGISCVSSDLLINDEMRLRLLNVSCTYKCLQYIGKDCKCNTSNIDFQSLPQPHETNTQLLCKEADKIVLSIHPETPETYSYFVEILTRRNKNTWTFFNWFNSSVILIDNLTENEEYKFRIWLLSHSGNLYKPEKTNWIKTMRFNDDPTPITAIELLRYEYNYSDYKAIITWNASEETSCHYEFVWFGGDDISDYTQKEVDVLYDNDFTVTIGSLVFNSNYSVAVMTKSTDLLLESEKVWFHFTTPHCLEVLNSLELCVPDMPTDIDAEEELITSDEDEQVYNINITWEEPEILPTYYIVHLNTFDSENNEGHSLNITGTSTTVAFNNVPLSLHYQVTIFAFSKAGRSDPAECYKQIKPRNIVSTNSYVSDKAFLIFVLPLVVILCLVSSLTVGYKERNKREQTTKRQRYFEELELKSFYLESPLPDDNISEKADEWEIDNNCLTLQSVLGRGAFGIVRKGWLRKEDTKVAVAVKMLLDDHRYTDMRDFKQEIEIMKSVGTHPHIVSLIGCCSKGKPDDLRLIVEYCARGDLLTYLRTAWEQITNQCNNIQYANFENYDLSNVDNKLYLLGVTDTWNMQIKDLLSIGLQIAMGMEYLSSLHVLHRDLAARNILVCEDRTVKVSDFGLSRDVYKDNVYCKTSSGKLPVRWLALESLTHQIYTTQSDVWSYGVLLWEIITLGGNPYPSVQTQELLDLLIKGYRMSCPSNCSQELFTIMMSCWSENPKDRPTFSDIHSLLDDILEHTSEYLNLNVCNSLDDDLMKGNAKTKSLSSERYVKAFAQ